MADISLRGIRKSYGRTEVIHGVDCEIGDGEFIVVVGPSGCGKSTLLRMIAGLESVTQGEIAIGGRVVNRLEPAERDIAMVFQNYALYPHMTVYNNMAYGLKNRGLDKREIDAKVRRAAEILELQKLLARRPRQLSGGQRQRVAMGRAIVREPQAFLFDEPLSNLDAKLRVQMRIEIKRLHDELKTTSVYVTHDQVEAMTLGQRLLVMNAGRAEQIGRPLELYQKPQTAFVASFIGSPSMNLLDAESLGGGAIAPHAAAGGRIALAAEPAPAGTRLCVGLRPEHLRVIDGEDNGDSSDGGPGDNRLRLRAEMVEELGADTLIHGRLGENGPPLTVRAPGTRHASAGDALTVAFEPDHVHVFAADESGLRLN